MNPLVSVIVPTYNRKAYLVECLDSVLAQTYKPIELILVDDGSTDGTDREVQERYGAALSFIRMGHSGLPAVARNAGLEKSRGAYVAFCDSDDVWLPHKLEIQISRMSSAGCNCSCSDAFLLGRGGETYLRHHTFTHTNPSVDLLRDNFFITSSVVLERELLKGRRFPTSRWLRGYEDYAFWLSLAPELRPVFVDEPLLQYRKHEAGLSSALRRQDARKQLRILWSQPVYAAHPVLWARKLLRYCYRLIA